MEDQVHSVALLLTNEAGLLYCVRERQANPKYGKRVGDHSFPWETQKPNERILRTLHRLIVEEVDATDQIEMSFPIEIGSVPVYDTVAHVFVASFLGGPLDMRGFHDGIEIDALGWQTRDFLLSPCRDGVLEVLGLGDKFQSDLKACR